MLAAYGVDTLDPAVTCRRVWVLLERLPPSALRPGEAWSTESELLAVLIDHVAALTWVTMRAHGAKSAQRPAPVPRPRPRQRAPVPAAPAPPSAPLGAPGEVKHATWADAAEALAGMAGMRRRG